MSTTTLKLDQFIDPFEAKVVYKRDAAGSIVDARFDLGGLPRLDPLLIGKDVMEVPDIVKRLCGLCPVTHHLAGVRALDALHGARELTPTATLVRGLLNDASILDAIAPRLFGMHRELAVALKKFGKSALAAAGSSGHFPDVAVPGGVRAPADPVAVAELCATLPALIDALAELPEDFDWRDEFTGLSIALHRDGVYDPLGSVVLASDGSQFPVEDFAQHVAESVPGATAPRPVLDGQPYRVGPIAALAVAGKVAGPQSAQKYLLRQTCARINAALHNPELCEGPVQVAVTQSCGEGVGIVEGPRGVLVHRYVTDEGGKVTQCQILTPTAQNEGWMSQMLRSSLQADTSLETSIRAADPCLPITSAPAGAMEIHVAEEG